MRLNMQRRERANTLKKRRFNYGRTEIIRNPLLDSAVSRYEEKEILSLVNAEVKRIKADPAFAHLIKG